MDKFSEKSLIFLLFQILNYDFEGFKIIFRTSSCHERFLRGSNKSNIGSKYFFQHFSIFLLIFEKRCRLGRGRNLDLVSAFSKWTLNTTKNSGSCFQIGISWKNLDQKNCRKSYGADEPRACATQHWANLMSLNRINLNFSITDNLLLSTSRTKSDKENKQRHKWFRVPWVDCILNLRNDSGGRGVQITRRSVLPCPGCSCTVFWRLP